MIARTQADELRALRAAEPAVLSVYLSVPLDLAEHRGLPVRARELIRAAAAWRGGHGADAVSEADVRAVSEAIDEHSMDWLGHTVAIFACAGLGLLQTIPLPGWVSEQAVVSARPYTRPLLAALQRSPAYRTALIDNRHAWILSIRGDEVETVAERAGAGVPSTAFAGWYGLQAHRMQQRIMTLARRHYREVIEILEHPADGEQRPLVLGGQRSEVSSFIGALPRQVAASVAGSFHADLAVMTPARVRDLAAPVIARFTGAEEATAVRDVLDGLPGTAAVTDLPGCLAASRSRAIAGLILPDDVLIPGYACDTCGTLGVGDGGCDCPDPAGSCRAVPDVLDELASRTLDGGGEVISVREPPFPAAARLRFPIQAATGGRLP
ncbi:MAG TPA: hypothetical protein VLX31_17830 [Streptosporangiaceae bacterium]|nr:hypothetical protein [Streptosporangiaceae bacterium]